MSNNTSDIKSLSISDQIQGYINVYMMCAIGNYIMETIRQFYRKPTKNDLIVRIEHLETQIITQTIKNSGEVIIP